jgi:hypothetical protein
MSWINSSAALASNMPGVDNATGSADFVPNRRRATRRASSARMRLRMLLRAGATKFVSRQRRVTSLNNSSIGVRGRTK